MTTCQAVADDWAEWEGEAMWQTLYFGVGPLVTRGLVGLTLDIERAKASAAKATAAKPSAAKPSAGKCL